MLSSQQDNVPLAFVLVIAAWLATGFGALLVFNSRLIALASSRSLACALSASAGVMLYVSFIEIFTKSYDAFKLAGYEEANAHCFATLAFFGGVGLGNFLEHLGLHLETLYNRRKGGQSEANAQIQQLEGQQQELESDVEHKEVDLSNVEEGRFEMNLGNSGKGELQPSVNPMALDADKSSQGSVQEAEKQRLHHIGMIAAVALGCHNFPEGLATFVATIDDPSVGAALALAISIHNIPEGICVSIPIFYATGSRWRAFLTAVLSGLSEPLGALLGYLVLYSCFSYELYGSIFGIVAGLMINICLRELIPTAHKYDPKDKVSSKGIIFGMMIMAMSLVLFLY
mmetsp:Transcript_38691/g.50983  ORF Transcript_38691/g.50983 Transcript_38691/m.50983 type:complete len:342 (+) Transcript_38691:151-1176(+)|eukprot:CAMPEP_0117757156 /NCGR_PEP_ID=MMETSP0947-20121206/14544_1 /TAXON_ID=44440 /ORGANISM="Chattonella subsalsa, Strain CCMP2191" /LENGTH=341 /DNA_ID=CAMNT_0005576957 /DNA_START=146 /DNA_END=1171 /DNA_ORIENTATION=+